MKRIVFLLFSCCLSTFSLHGADFIGNKSPDGRFGLLLKPNDSPSKVDISIIEISSHKTLVRLEPYDETDTNFGRVYPNALRLLWAPDSKHVAFYCQYRRGGGTTVYFLTRSQFTEAALPKWPNVDPRFKANERVKKFLSDDVTPMRWLNSKTLVLQEDNESAFDKLDRNGEVVDQGLTAKAVATVTVSFGANKKASLQSLTLRSDRAITAQDSGEEKLEDHNNDGAIAEFGNAIKLDPTNAEAYERRGDAKEAKGDNDGAIADYTRCIELEPINADAYNARGDARLATGDKDGAIGDYDSAIELEPINGEVYNRRGDAKHAKGDDDGAIPDYSTSIELDPNNAANAYNGRGVVKQDKGDNDGAIADYSKAIELQPDAVKYFNRGTANFAKRDWVSALADFRQSRQLNDGDQYSPPFIWLILARQNQKEAANKELAADMAKHLSGPPDDWASEIAYFLLDKINQADFLAAAASPDTERQRDQQCDVWFYAGMKRLLAGDKTAAIDYFQKALATGAKTENEYDFAGSELKALGK